MLQTSNLDFLTLDVDLDEEPKAVSNDQVIECGRFDNTMLCDLSKRPVQVPARLGVRDPFRIWVERRCFPKW